VIKFAPYDPTLPRLTFIGTLTSKACAYRPVVFTAKDDNSVGETITGSTGSPTNTYATVAASCEYLSAPVHIEYWRVAYAENGFYARYNNGHSIRHSQFVNCWFPLVLIDTTAAFENLLLYNSSYTAIAGNNATASASHLTVNQFDTLLYDVSLSLTNSLLVDVTNIGEAFTSDHNATNFGGGIFQSVGAGYHYLADGSTNRNWGTTNISATLLADLGKTTTYPPLVLTNKETNDVTLVPQAERDTNTPDLGYHYDPLDYITDVFTITNATLTLTNAVAIGSYYEVGIWLQDGSQIISAGSPTELNRLVRYTTVQEQPLKLGSWALDSAASVYPSAYGSVKAAGAYRFTEFSTLAGGGYHLHSFDGGWQYSNLVVRDCWFRNGKSLFRGNGDSRIAVTNNLFERSGTLALSSFQFFFRNNLVRYGTLSLANCGTNTWLVRDNSFDSCTVGDDEDCFNHTADHNAYINTSGTLINTNSTDVFLTNFTYATGPLGDYYQVSTSLIDRGSANAAAVGLYHYTTQTNQGKETNSMVDIGFHYVTVTNGVATDLDGDGIPDFADSDADGDGMPDDWELAHGLNPLLNDASDDPDGDWLTNYQEYNGGTNSTNPREVMVVAWGDNSDGQCTVPESLRDVIAIAAGDDFSLALREDGSVVAWGVTNAGQTTVPVDLTNAVAISANFDHAMAVRNDGSLSMWGAWSWGNYTYSLSQPSGLTNVALVAAGANHDLALRGNGMVTAWGTFGSTPYITIPTNVVSARSVAAGYAHSVASLSTCLVVAWGEPLWWNLTDVPAGLSNVVAVAAGDYHTLALKTDGTVVAWGAGNSTNGSLWADFEQSIVPAGLSNVSAIAASGYRSLALRADGTTVGWGENFFGQGSAPPGVSNLTAIAAGPFHTLGIRSGRLTPFIWEQPSRVAQTNGGTGSFTVRALSLAGALYQWQFNGVNIAGATNATLPLSNVGPTNEGDYQVIVSTGAGSITSSVATFTLITPPVITSQTQPDRQWVPLAGLPLAVNATAPAQWASPLNYQWRSNGISIASGTASNYYVRNFLGGEERQFQVVVTNAAGSTNSMTWKVRSFQPGGVAAWGSDDAGELDWPADLTNVIAVAAGEFHSVAVKEDGAAVQWGEYWIGSEFFPVGAAPGYSNLVAVAAGAEHDLGLKADGTVVSWGLTNAVANYVPANLAGVKAIAAGWDHNVVLKTNGAVVAWGSDLFGQTDAPPDLTNITAIAAGVQHSLALRADGTVVAWGYNPSGQTNVPGGLSNVVAVAAGGRHSLALKQDGQVVAWGYNNDGQCDVPAGLSNVMGIAAGWAHSVALKNNGAVVAWGDNSGSQTDIGVGLSGIKSIAAGGDHTLATIFSPLVQYSVDVTKDLLLIYNAGSTDSSNVWYYYMQHRPMVSGANVLGIECPASEGMGTNDFVTKLKTPVLNWLNANPTKHPQYVILFPYIPQVLTNGNDQEINYSVSVLLYEQSPGIKPFITCISMTNAADCIGYINKLEQFGTNYSPGKLIISAGAGVYGNTNFYFDGAEANSDLHERHAREGVLAYGASTSAVHFAATTDSRITNAVNVAGYLSEGAHGWQTRNFAVDGHVIFTGNSGWYVMATDESYNGTWYVPSFGGFTTWFSNGAFGGVNHSNTPVGAVCHVSEPGTLGNDVAEYYGLWQAGKSFAICAWYSRWSPQVQAIGDPFVRR
jgi:alpha-tubulin suppressor-like RCC1 family protein